MTLPPLPSEIWSPLGPIPVTLVDGLTAADDGCRLYGRYNHEQRVIELDTAPALLVQWQTLHHEWLHSVLHDHGFELGPFEEPVVETVATALIALWLSGAVPPVASAAAPPKMRA